MGKPAFEIDNETIAAVLRDEGFDFPITSVRHIPEGRVNDNYLVEYEGGSAVLRVWRLSSPTQVIAELTALQRLAEHDFPGPRRLIPRTSVRSFTVADSPAALFSFIEGEHLPLVLPLELSDERIDLAAQVGVLIAQAHVALADLMQLDFRELSYADRLRERKAIVQSLDVAGATGDRLARILNAITQEEQNLAHHASSDRLPLGLIHDDPGSWNVLVQNGSVVALLDFDIIHQDLLIYDIAHLITQWASCANPTAFHGHDAKAIRSIVKAYDSVRPLSKFEREALARAVPVRQAIDLLVPLRDVLGSPDWDSEDYLDRFDMMALRDDAAWLDLFS